MEVGRTSYEHESQVLVGDTRSAISRPGIGPWWQETLLRAGYCHGHVNASVESVRGPLVRVIGFVAANGLPHAGGLAAGILAAEYPGQKFRPAAYLVMAVQVRHVLMDRRPAQGHATGRLLLAVPVQQAL